LKTLLAEECAGCDIFRPTYYF